MPIETLPRGSTRPLATIAQRFRFAMVPGQRVTPTPYVTLRSEPGIRMRLEPPLNAATAVDSLAPRLLCRWSKTPGPRLALR